MKVIAVILCSVLLTHANVLKSKHHKEWDQFVAEHKKTYSSDVEREFRFKIFVENLVKVERHNKEYEEGKTTFTMAINKFSDMLNSEVFTGLILPTSINITSNVPTNHKGDAPDSIDWREKGAVTPVKDQGQCGSCWAFSATGSLEGQHFLKTGQLVSLSEKNLMDCSWDFGNNGCGGGWVDDAFAYVIKNHGIDTEESYPYEAVEGECQFDPAYIGTVAKSFVDLPKEDEEAIKEAVGTVGPVSVAINANDEFQHYSGGIMKSRDCNEFGLNHGVLIVGYGTEDGQDYWIVKNSWGASWGEDGYIRMARNYHNMCGIAWAASYPTL